MSITIEGEAPHQYVTMPFENFNQKVYLNEYELRSEDWFEVGFGHSIHATPEDAKSYYAGRSWRCISRAKPIYVRQSTLDDIVKEKDRRIWKSWEN